MAGDRPSRASDFLSAGSTSLPKSKTPSVGSQLKRSIFRYHTQIGHFPKEVVPFLYVKRTDPRSRATRVAPELVYPIEANRPAVPKHAFLEDNWRAFRSVLHNYQTLTRSQASPEQRLIEYLQCSLVAGRIYGQLNRDARSIEAPTFVPALAMYKDSMGLPLGYVYRRYQQHSSGTCDPQPQTGRQHMQIPVLVFEGPFMDTVHISQGDRVKATGYKDKDDYDADVIVTQSCSRTALIYNEPEAIPLSCARTDFSLSLTQRAIKMTASCGSRATTVTNI